MNRRRMSGHRANAASEPTAVDDIQTLTLTNWVGNAGGFLSLGAAADGDGFTPFGAPPEFDFVSDDVPTAVAEVQAKLRAWRDGSATVSGQLTGNDLTFTLNMGGGAYPDFQLADWDVVGAPPTLGRVQLGVLGSSPTNEIQKLVLPQWNGNPGSFGFAFPGCGSPTISFDGTAADLEEKFNAAIPVIFGELTVPSQFVGLTVSVSGGDLEVQLEFKSSLAGHPCPLCIYFAFGSPGGDPGVVTRLQAGDPD